MMDGQDHPLQYLTATEQDCVRRYVSLLTANLGNNLLEVRLFGSAARGDMWPRHLPMHSDIDLLVLTQAPLSAERQEELVNETYPLYLECGRQIGPQWRTVEQWAWPKDEREKAFKTSVEAEGRTLYRRAA